MLYYFKQGQHGARNKTFINLLRVSHGCHFKKKMLVSCSLPPVLFCLDNDIFRHDVWLEKIELILESKLFSCHHSLRNLETHV